mgnify:CR=1 FL=1
MTIIPQPKKLKKTGGFVSTAGLDIVLTVKCDSRIFKAAQKRFHGMTPAMGASASRPFTSIFPIRKEITPFQPIVSQITNGYKLFAGRMIL